MECKRIHWPNMVDVVNGLSMALERVLLLLGLWTRVKVLDRNPSLYRAGRVSCERTHRDLCQSSFARYIGQGIPSPSDMHASARVMNFKLLSRVCATASILRMSYMWKSRLAIATTRIWFTRSMLYTRSGRSCEEVW